MRLKNCNVQEFIGNLNERKVICFGAGSTLIEADFEILVIEGLEEHISFFVDNDSNKYGLKFSYRNCNFDIKSIEVLNEVQVTKFVLLITCASYVEVYRQLTTIENLNNMECYFYNCICSYPKLDINNFFKHEIKKMPYSNYKEIFQSLNLKDCYQGKRCFIIGNGPSLKVEDLECLKDEITFAANRIFAIFDKTDWRPTYYFCIDYLMYGLDHEKINKIDSKLKFVPIERALAAGTVYNCITYYNRSVKCVDVVDNQIVRSSTFQFSEDISKEVFGGQTVVYDMLQFAMYMGFNEIYLLGMDHTYRFELNGEGKIVETNVKQNHFNKEYDKRLGSAINVVGMIEVATIAYEKANSVAIEKKVMIKNATRGGKLEVFERVDFTSLFSK